MKKHLQSYAESQPSLDARLLSYEPYGYFFLSKRIQLDLCEISVEFLIWNFFFWKNLILSFFSCFRRTSDHWNSIVIQSIYFLFFFSWLHYAKFFVFHFFYVTYILYHNQLSVVTVPEQNSFIHFFFARKMKWWSLYSNEKTILKRKCNNFLIMPYFPMNFTWKKWREEIQ